MNYLYLLKIETKEYNIFKIGVSNNIENRIAGLKLEHKQFDNANISIIWKKGYEDRWVAFFFERHIKKTLKDKRVCGHEYFLIHPIEMYKTIRIILTTHIPEKKDINLKTKQVSIRMPESLIDEIDKLSKEKSRSLTGQIIYLLKEKLKELGV